MNSNEWPLVFFTLFAQISAGMLVCVLIVAASAINQSLLATTRVKTAIILTALILMSVALLISFLHLSLPRHAVFALDGLRTSWLSREILFSALFLAMLLTSYLTLRFNILKRTAFDLLLTATAIAGLVLIYTMVRLYMLPTIPPWNNVSTPIAFFNTALLAGPAMTLTYIAFFVHRGIDTHAFVSVLKTLAIMVMAGAFIHAVNALFLIPDNTLQARDTAVFLPELAPAIWKLSRWVFLLSGVAAMTVWLVRIHRSSSNTGPWLACLATACFLMAEVCARYLFYASYYRIGV